MLKLARAILGAARGRPETSACPCRRNSSSLYNVPPPLSLTLQSFHLVLVRHLSIKCDQSCVRVVHNCYQTMGDIPKQQLEGSPQWMAGMDAWLPWLHICPHSVGFHVSVSIMFMECSLSSKCEVKRYGNKNLRQLVLQKPISYEIYSFSRHILILRFNLLF